MAPSAGDFEYLIASDANPSDLNDPYYGLFNAEKKFSDGNLRPEIGAPHTTTAEEVAAAWVDEKVREAVAAIGAAAAPAPDARRYVHPFVCNACSRTCTMETVSSNPHFSQLPSDMLCPFRLPGFTAIWKAGPVEALT